ncbi:hypothetical protein [Pseudomonas fulva]|uniref:Uncharacterized protein n=1 Tax=Pseudomonas fulva (strain 12-X) TaxID=743720 RepID=F6AG36_PSEF1|nr:hypothetical protein [Pseudomonas fulva]AEF21438.1 hypothetical protein Psefu_1462 [Pseudomonas fulva 12-X]
MADAVLYSHLDPGAPPLKLGMVDSSVNGVVSWYNLLYPCLVTGYGSGANAKPGQGWALIHANLPNHFTLKSPDGVFYSFGKGSNTYPYAPKTQLFLSELVTDATVFPPVGTNVRSYHHSVDYSSNSARHWVVAGRYFSEAMHSWFVIARGSQVHIITNAGTNSSDGMGGYGEPPTTTSGYYGTNYFFGNFLFSDPEIPKSGPGNHMALGGSFEGEATQFSSEGNSGYVLSYGTRLRNPFTGAVETSGMPTIQAYCSLPTGYGGAKLGVPAYAPDMQLCPHHVYDSVLGYIARLPGLLRDEYYSHRSANEVSRALGKGGTLAECLIPFDYAGEGVYMIPTQYGTSFICLKEKYWNA